jgi:hypothetical protein
MLNRYSARNIDVPGNDSNTGSGTQLSLFFSQAAAKDQQWRLKVIEN